MLAFHSFERFWFGDLVQLQFTQRCGEDGPWVRIMALSTNFSSSRTLPGQFQFMSVVRVFF